MNSAAEACELHRAGQRMATMYLHQHKMHHYILNDGTSLLDKHTSAVLVSQWLTSLQLGKSIGTMKADFATIQHL